MRRIAVKTRALLRLTVSIAVYALAFALLFFIGLLLNAVVDVIEKPFVAVLYAGALFSVFGALYGTIVVLDESADFRSRHGRLVRTFELPRLRALLGAAWGAIAVYLATHLLGKSAPPSALLVGALVGAILGWLGWRWARHVDF